MDAKSIITKLVRSMESINNHKCYLYSFSPEDCAKDKWDYGLLNEIFNKYSVEEIRVTSLPTTERAFVVIPGPQNLGHEYDINKEIQNISRLILFITGDEEGKFDIDKINHPNAEIWIQYPHKKHQNYNKLPVGVPKHLKEFVPEYPYKDNDLYFGGQITHPRRQQLAKVMKTMPNALLRPTEGFAQGDKPVDYYRTLASAKIAPAPSGAVVIDSFRFFEAIEMLCLPIADRVDPNGNSIDFYGMLFEDNIPVEAMSNWSKLTKIVPTLLDNYPGNMHQVVCWWIKYKRDLGIKLMRQINA
jgi:hypothetical protein